MQDLHWFKVLQHRKHFQPPYIDRVTPEGLFSFKVQPAGYKKHLEKTWEALLQSVASFDFDFSNVYVRDKFLGL